MSDVFAQRGVVDALRLEHETALASADDQEVALPLLELSINNGTFEGHHPFTNQEWLEINRENQRQRREAVAEKKARLEDAERALEATLGEGKPLFRQRNAEPIALLPVRLETRFADASTIQVRVYPDDLHIDSFDPRLTRAELEAGRRYWRKPSEAAWQRLLGRLSPARAAWVTRATRRGAPAPRLRRPGQRRSPAISTLPTRWRFLGLVGGSIVVDKRGEPIPSPLPLGVLEVDEADRKHAAWVVHFKAAERAGMATTLTLPDGVAHLDELFVIGVQRSTPAAASKALRDTLMGHAFGAGLGFLAPGTPTNNTPQSRSGWSSRPLPRPPGPRRPKLERGTDAARLAGALGLPDAAFLAECPGAGGKAEQALAGLTMLTWGALGHGMMDASIENDLVSGQGGLADAEKWRPVRDHLIDYVRSRGPLPTIRVGNQPYGVLPATTLDEWEAKLIMGPTTVFVPWLLRLRHHWRAALAPGWIPRVTDGEPADRTAVAVLSRLPVPVDLAVRRMLLPNGTRDKLRSRASGPALSIGGVGPGSNLRWSMATELTSNLSFTGNETPPDYALGMQRLDPEPGGLTEVLTASRELWTDALAVVRGKLELREYRRRRRRRPDTLASISGNREFPGLVAAMLHPDNWFAWNVDDGADDPLREALSLPGAVDDLASLLLGPAPSGDDELIAQARTTARKCARRAPEVIEAIAALEATPPDRLLPLAFEVLDVYSHRLDAWITSLATRRLLAMRDTGESTASRIGGYGWVENLRPKENLPQIDGYIHAPSLHHAATAAVLRSGFRSHDGDETLAVNLTSRRARIARWLLGGVRRGQELGSLLGYRFERALHEAGQDELIDDFRRAYPAQVAPEPEAGADPEEWRRSSVAIAARNIVDGIALARDHVRAASVFPAAAPQIADAVDALDAVSDLLLAESVHQLVGGNAMRAGLSADNLGRGEQVPDRFDVLRTPHRGRAVTHRIAAILPRAASAGEGWSPDALSALDPRVDAWVADALGPAQSRRVTGTLTREGGVGEPFAFGADQLGFGALTTALEVSGADHARLDARVLELAGAAGATLRYEGQGWQELRGVATRVASLLASAQPLLPGHVAAGDAAEKVEADLAELQARLAEFAATLAGRSDPATPAGRLRKLARQAPDGGWLATVSTALADVLGAPVPVTPLLRGGELGPAPEGATGAELADWARRLGAVRPAVRTWHELLLLTGAGSGAPCPLSASQSPRGDASERWIGGPFKATARPAARQQVVFHQPAKLTAGRPLAGIVFDEWVELLPGSDALAQTKLEGPDPLPAESELTGVSFHFDRPDAKAPQAILLAVPPTRARGWTEDVLALVVRDTLELAKLRAVDVGALPLVDDVAPGIRLNKLSPLGSLAFDFWVELADE
ncbi:MAG TPA: hypothetical protein VFB44_00355 [Thermoleophilaceae bacterium]|nr:hypothetical protein [Thermoleophilaceae bacterium]